MPVRFNYFIDKLLSLSTSRRFLVLGSAEYALYWLADQEWVNANWAMVCGTALVGIWIVCETIRRTAPMKELPRENNAT